MSTKKSFAATRRAPLGPVIFELGVQCDHDRRPIGRGVGIGERATDRLAVADLRIGDSVRRLTNDRENVVQWFGSEQLGVSGQRADPDGLMVDRKPF